MPHHRAQHSAQFIGGSGLVGNAGHELDDVIAPHIRCALVTMLPAQPLDREPVAPLR